MVISQASEGATTIITTLQAGVSADGGGGGGAGGGAGDTLTINWDTWAFGSAPGGKRDGAVYALRTLRGSYRQVTGVIVSKLLEGTSNKPTATREPTGVSTPPPNGIALQFNISAGETVTVITTVLTSVTTDDVPPLTQALADNAAVATDHSGGAAAKIEEEAALFWQQFWGRSSVSLGPKWGEAERFWYASQYLIAMASRTGRIAPGLWGPWVSTDSPAWCGGYTLDCEWAINRLNRLVRW
jgi:hypothetical protein